MINQVILLGRLTKDPMVEYTTGGKAVTHVTLAVQRHFRNAAGEIETDFVNCTMWEREAENVSLYCSKGSTICITGRIATRRYEDADGKMNFFTEVVTDRLVFVDRKRTGAKKDSSVEVSEENSEAVGQ